MDEIVKKVIRQRTLQRVCQIERAVHREKNKKEVTAVEGHREQEDEFPKGHSLPAGIPVASHHRHHDHIKEVTTVPLKVE